MSAKAACVIPRRWTLEDYALHTCADRSHGHLSRVELADNLRHGFVEVLRHGNSKAHLKPVVRLVRTLPARGLSCSVGAELAAALRDDAERGWAIAMLNQIRGRRESLMEDTGYILHYEVMA